MGCQEHALIRTPHMDASAARGTLFRNAYSNAPVGVPGRAALMTGRFGSDVNSYSNSTCFAGTVPTWGNLLRDAGYHCWATGKLHLTGEFHNLAANPAHRDVQQQLQNVLRGLIDPEGATRRGFDQHDELLRDLIREDNSRQFYAQLEKRPGAGQAHSLTYLHYRKQGIIVKMRRLLRDYRQYSFSAAHTPVLTLEPGESIIVETNDARTGSVRTSADLLDKPHPSGANPVTGPIQVAGAEPGDSLIVHVRDIALGRQAYTGVKAKIGLLAGSASHYVTKILPVEEGYIRFSDTLRFPVWPMIGAIGVAPPTGEIASLYPGAHGGNMDNKFVRPGCSLHLPVLIPGANFALGDVHASMGDGEVSMVGLETEAEVTIKIDLAKRVEIARPWIEDDGRWITTGDGMDTDDALRMACHEMVALLMRRLKISFEEAYMLASIRADLAICQACDPGRFPVTTRMSYEFQR